MVGEPKTSLYRYAMKLRDGIRESPRFAGLYPDKARSKLRRMSWDTGSDRP
jgi:hypothetical protein